MMQTTNQRNLMAIRNCIPASIVALVAVGGDGHANAATSLVGTFSKP
jgi:hypothetical protein